MTALRTTRCDLCRALKHEYYAVHDRVWRASGLGNAVACVACLEGALSRRLTPADFSDAPINRRTLRSDTLRNRMGEP